MSKMRTHTFYRRSSVTRCALSDIIRTYWRNLSNGDDHLIQFAVLRGMADTFLHDDILREVRELIRSLHILQATRISPKHNYQKYPRDLPKPVLPDFVQTALVKHRAQYGKDSIF